jgi:hypothetical protein
LSWNINTNLDVITSISALNQSRTSRRLVFKQRSLVIADRKRKPLSTINQSYSYRLLLVVVNKGTNIKRKLVGLKVFTL